MRVVARGSAVPVAVALLVLLLLPLAGARPALAQGNSDEQALLERFAPVMAIRHQSTKCGDGERFRPVSVDVVLGRDDVVLRDASGTVVAKAPTAEDLAGLGDDRWLDLPGNALKPGCTYEKWFKSLDATPSIYGRVTKDQGHLVLQYWFYWVYNQWNDVHESDWEGIQLQFDTDDVDEAMSSMPSRYAYAQHEGAEYADPGDSKVKLVDGTHPVVYAAQGSHASYFSSTRWFGKSGATGFGCDDTSSPIDRIRPAVIRLPQDAPTSGDFAWLSYTGHWGQKEPFFDDGPTGPATKDRWDQPLEWVDNEGRDDAVAVPFARSGATDAFCSLSASGSALFNQLLDNPVRVVVLVAVAVLAIILMVRLASRGLLTRAARTWRHHARTLLRIGGVVVIGGLIAWLLQLAIVALTPLGNFVDVVGTSSAWVLPVVALTQAAILVPLIAWVVGATIAVESGEDDAARALRAGVGTRSVVLLTTMVVVALLGLSLVVLPPLVLLVSIWIVAPATTVREHLTLRASLGRSRRLLQGHRWRALGLVITLCLVIAAGGLVGALVLVLTSVGFTVATLAVAVANAFIVPYSALVIALFYEELAPAPA
jgi:hypothetical protein